jgi:hypothetical protein
VAAFRLGFSRWRRAGIAGAHAFGEGDNGTSATARATTARVRQGGRGGGGVQAWLLLTAARWDRGRRGSSVRRGQRRRECDSEGEQVPAWAGTAARGRGISRGRRPRRSRDAAPIFPNGRGTQARWKWLQSFLMSETCRRGPTWRRMRSEEAADGRSRTKRRQTDEEFCRTKKNCPSFVLFSCRRLIIFLFFLETLIIFLLG